MNAKIHEFVGKGPGAPSLLDIFQEILALKEIVLALLQAAKPRKAVREPQAMDIVAMKRSSFRAIQNDKESNPAYDPDFPQAIPLGNSGRMSAWYVHELEEWLELQAAKRSKHHA